jgi:hypothetical protein
MGMQLWYIHKQKLQNTPLNFAMSACLPVHWSLCPVTCYQIRNQHIYITTSYSHIQILFTTIWQQMSLSIEIQKHFSSNLNRNLLNNYLQQECSHRRCRENWNTFYARICTTAWPVIMVSLIRRHNWYSTSKHMDWKILETKASHNVCALSFMHTTHRTQAHKRFKSIKFSCVRRAWKYTELTDKPYDLTISTSTLSIWQPFHPP